MISLSAKFFGKKNRLNGYLIIRELKCSLAKSTGFNEVYCSYHCWEEYNKPFVFIQTPAENRESTFHCHPYAHYSWYTYAKEICAINHIKKTHYSQPCIFVSYYFMGLSFSEFVMDKIILEFVVPRSNN